MRGYLIIALVALAFATLARAGATTNCGTFNDDCTGCQASADGCSYCQGINGFTCVAGNCGTFSINVTTCGATCPDTTDCDTCLSNSGCGICEIQGFQTTCSNEPGCPQFGTWSNSSTICAELDQCVGGTDCATCTGISGCGWCSFGGFGGSCSTQNRCSGGQTTWSDVCTVPLCGTASDCTTCIATDISTTNNNKCTWCQTGSSATCQDPAVCFSTEINNCANANPCLPLANCDTCTASSAGCQWCESSTSKACVLDTATCPGNTAALNSCTASDPCFSQTTCAGCAAATNSSGGACTFCQGFTTTTCAPLTCSGQATPITDCSIYAPAPPSTTSNSPAPGTSSSSTSGVPTPATSGTGSTPVTNGGSPTKGNVGVPSNMLTPSTTSSTGTPTGPQSGSASTIFISAAALVVAVALMAF